MSELIKIKNRIRALSEKTIDRGCSEAEAFNAAEMVGRLLDQYNLTMEECDVREEKCVRKHVDFQMGKRLPISNTVMAISVFTGCKAWVSSKSIVSRNRGGIGYRRLNTGITFFGHEADVELAIYLFNVVVAAYNNATNEFKKHPDYAGRSSTVSFQHGFAGRISSRLYKMKNDRDAALAAAATTGTALVALKGELIEKELKEQGIRLTSYTYNTRINDGFAACHGQNAANKVNLSNPISNNHKVAGYL